VRWPLSNHKIAAFLFIILICGVCIHLLCRDSRDLANYKKVQIGMTVDEVQAILGTGTPVRQTEVPSIVVALNPKDEEAARERARMNGGPPSTARDYPTKHKPVVEGDHILKWKNAETGELILVAFKEGRVCEKYFYDANYL
jgi:hypothetical protein